MHCPLLSGRPLLAGKRPSSHVANRPKAVRLYPARALHPSSWVVAACRNTYSQTAMRTGTQFGVRLGIRRAHSLRQWHVVDKSSHPVTSVIAPVVSDHLQPSKPPFHFLADARLLVSLCLSRAPLVKIKKITSISD